MLDKSWSMRNFSIYMASLALLDSEDCMASPFR